MKVRAVCSLSKSSSFLLRGVLMILVTLIRVIRYSPSQNHKYLSCPKISTWGAYCNLCEGKPFFLLGLCLSESFETRFCTVSTDTGDVSETFQCDISNCGDDCGCLKRVECLRIVWGNNIFASRF
ncbi:hypothetical protein KC19_7G174000 [Ceratodon purpureus]|uniref:Uncharacterized protein n=1 Tax=Ceratodon purpureus TaxID=3225 RepID=A0A8T0HB97_CERPU|nr:hypothetical protein KC19_7G174000 [Ceratodon purpureus]